MDGSLETAIHFYGNLIVARAYNRTKETIMDIDEEFDCPKNNKTSWINVSGQEFTEEERWDAQDFYDIIKSTGWVTRDLLRDIVEKKKQSGKPLRVGHMLFLAMNLPIKDLGVISMMQGIDDRVGIVCAARIQDINQTQDGRSNIILPGENDTIISDSNKRRTI